MQNSSLVLPLPPRLLSKDLAKARQERYHESRHALLDCSSVQCLKRVGLSTVATEPFFRSTGGSSIAGIIVVEAARPIASARPDDSRARTRCQQLDATRWIRISKKNNLAKATVAGLAVALAMVPERSPFPLWQASIP